MNSGVLLGGLVSPHSLVLFSYLMYLSIKMLSTSKYIFLIQTFSQTVDVTAYWTSLLKYLMGISNLTCQGWILWPSPIPHHLLGPQPSTTANINTIISTALPKTLKLLTLLTPHILALAFYQTLLIYYHTSPFLICYVWYFI